MSKLIACVVLDEKAEAYGHPFFVPALGIALRMFSDWAGDKNTAVGLHPEDYRLYRIGTFDQVSGVLEHEQVPVFLQNANNLVNTSGEVFGEPANVAQGHFSDVHGKGESHG